MASIQIQWLGHSCFRVECQGYAVVLDPFEPGSVPGLRDIRQTADQVLCSHQHHDHNYRAGVALRRTARRTPSPSRRCPPSTTAAAGRSGAPTPSTCGKPRDCGWPTWGTSAPCPPPMWWSSSRTLDAVLVPVGGFYTVGPKEAKEIVDALQARVVIPMHYRSDAFGFDVLAPVEDFLELDSHWMRYETDTLEITRTCATAWAVLTYGR